MNRRDPINARALAWWHMVGEDGESARPTARAAWRSAFGAICCARECREEGDARGVAHFVASARMWARVARHIARVAS